MIPDLGPVFEKYEAFLRQLDGVFERVGKQHADCVRCKVGCADCCHALFDLSLVEALYINRRFLEKVPEEKKKGILDEANTADRRIYRLKHKAFKAVDAGDKSEQQVLMEMAAERVRCPLLNAEDRCELYDYRPVTCRLYGIPMSIAGRGHTCGLSGFKEGEAYPTVNLDPVHKRLHELSMEIVDLLNTTQTRMGDVLMPLSMALLTVFDEAYLGIKTEKEQPAQDQE